MDFYNTLEIDGYKVRYFDSGKGEPVVLLHGFCLSSSSFELIAPGLANDFRVISPDFPGFGGSDLIPGTYNFNNVAAWVDRFTERLGLQQFTLIGHSMGGYIALAYVEEYAEKIKGLGLFHSSAASDEVPKAEERTKVIEFVRKHGVAAFLPNYVKSLLYFENPDLVDRLIEIASRSSKDAVLTYAAAMRDRPDRQDLLKDLDIPVLFLMGRNDSRLPIFKMRDQFMLPKNAVKSVLQFAGHMGMYESDGACQAALRSFCKYALQSSLV